TSHRDGAMRERARASNGALHAGPPRRLTIAWRGPESDGRETDLGPLTQTVDPRAPHKEEGKMADLRKLTRRETVKSAAVAGGVVMGSGLLAACGSSGGSTSTSAGTPASAPQKKGGRLRVGITGGGSADTLDPHTQVSDADLARTIALFDLLTRARPSFALEDRLAAEYSS